MLKGFISDVDRTADAEQWGTYGYLPIDEPRGAMTILHRKVCEMVKRANPKILTGCTNALAEALGPWLDIYMCETLSRKEWGPPVGELVRRKGVRHWWTYRNILQSPFTPAFVRMWTGWSAEKLGLEGVTVWTYVQSMGDPETDLDAKDWGLVMNAPHAPVPFIAFEVMREGVDDMRYLATLRSVLAQTRDAALRREGQAFIQSVLAEAPLRRDEWTFAEAGALIQKHTPPAWTYPRYDEIRRRMAGLILRATAGRQ